MPMTRRDSITIPADDPIIVAVGGDNDIVIAQADKIGEEDVIYSTCGMQTLSPRRS